MKKLTSKQLAEWATRVKMRARVRKAFADDRAMRKAFYADLDRALWLRARARARPVGR